MNHEAFRYLLPGMVALLPIVLMMLIGSTIDSRVLLTTATAALFPVGWLLYNCYRQVLAERGRTYDDTKSFIRMLRTQIRVIWAPQLLRMLVDMTRVNQRFGVRALDISTYRETFRPQIRNVEPSAAPDDLNVTFLEHLSDLESFEDKSYDYARSMSSVRYGIESMAFSAVIGAIVGIAFYATQRGGWVAIAGWSFQVSTAALLGLLLFRRHHFAKAEHDARLNLITLTRFSVDRLDVPRLDVGPLDEVVARLTEGQASSSRIAIFDLDNTLLDGDIGESVLFLLDAQGQLKDFSWQEYVALAAVDRKAAYVRAVTAMRDIQERTVIDITRRILNGHTVRDTHQTDVLVKAPRPRPHLQSLVTRLSLEGIDCYVISASNDVSVKVVAWECFGIPPHRAFGIESRFTAVGRERVILNSLTSQVPVYEGKVAVARAIEAHGKVVLVAGDSAGDFALVREYAPGALTLWAGPPDICPTSEQVVMYTPTQRVT